MTDNNCTWEYKSNTNATTNDKEQFENLMKICNEQCKLQIIEEPTRLENTLDLIFTNETNLVTMIEVNKSKLSDHNLIEISTNYTTMNKYEVNPREDSKHMLKTLNFHTKTVNWRNINKIIEETKWEHNFETKDIIQSGKEFETIITNSAIENAPKKSPHGSNRKIPKERKKLHNRIKMLKREKHKAYSKEKKKKFENKILETEQKLLESRRSEKLENEKRCIDCMKENPRMFYSFINKQRNRRNEIGPFKKDGKYIYDGKEICESLKTEYTSQMSTRSNRENIQQFSDSNEDDLIDIEIDRKSIEDAIDELNEDSSAGPDGIPAIFLKRTKETISKPIPFQSL